MYSKIALELYEELLNSITPCAVFTKVAAANQAGLSGLVDAINSLAKKSTPEKGKVPLAIFSALAAGVPAYLAGRYRQKALAEKGRGDIFTPPTDTKKLWDTMPGISSAGIETSLPLLQQLMAQGPEIKEDYKDFTSI